MVAALSFACQTAGDREDLPSSAERPTPESRVSATTSDSLRLRIEVAPQVPAGEPVQIRLLVENVSARSLDLYLRGRTLAFDLVVSRADGTVVWRRLADEAIPAILRLETLSSGARLDLQDTWDQRTNAGQPVPDGAYLIRGEVLTEGPPLVTPDEPLRVGPS